MQTIMEELMTDDFDPINKACYKLKDNGIPYAVGDEDRYRNRVRQFTLLVPVGQEMAARNVLGLVATDKGGNQ